MLIFRVKKLNQEVGLRSKSHLNKNVQSVNVFHLEQISYFKSVAAVFIYENNWIFTHWGKVF